MPRRATKRCCRRPSVLHAGEQPSWEPGRVCCQGCITILRGELLLLRQSASCFDMNSLDNTSSSGLPDPRYRFIPRLRTSRTFCIGANTHTSSGAMGFPRQMMDDRPESFRGKRESFHVQNTDFVCVYVDVYAAQQSYFPLKPAISLPFRRARPVKAGAVNHARRRRRAPANSPAQKGGIRLARPPLRPPKGGSAHVFGRA